jgi:hypothetical protein
MPFKIRDLPEKLTIDVLSALKEPDGTLKGTEEELLARREDLAEIARAFNYRDINYVTLTAVHPEDMFFRACVAKVMRTVKIRFPEENLRGPAIWREAKKIFDAKIDEFRETIKEGGASDLALQEKQKNSQQFIERVSDSQKDESWNPEAYRRMWAKSRYSEVWQQNIIDKYETASQSSFSQDPSKRYEHKTGWDRKRAVSELIKFDTQYYHNLPIAYKLIDEHIASYPEDRKISERDLADIEGVIFTGGSGSGKSTMFRHFVLTLDYQGQDAYNMAYHNTDFAVYSMWEFARADKAIAPFLDAEHKGDQTHGSASDAAYMSLELRGQDAARTGKGPNVVAGSVEVNRDVIDDILLGGGKVAIHHISIDKEIAKQACQNRPDASGRIPPDDVIERSVRTSAASLSRITSGYNNNKVTAYIYERSAKESPAKLAAIIDCEKTEVIVYDMPAFIRSLGRSEIEETPEKSAKKMLEDILKDRFTIVSLGIDGGDDYKLKPDGKLEVVEGKLDTVDPQIRDLAVKGTEVGGRLINFRHSELKGKSIETRQ